MWRWIVLSHSRWLRFELSEGGEAFDQVLMALRKATGIVEFVFSTHDVVLVCLRLFMGSNPYSLRRSLRELANAGVLIPKHREFWLEAVALDDRWDEKVEEWNAYIAFEFPIARIQNLLWCAFATDFPGLRPNPHCSIYFIDLENRILVHPYDDRGMDIVGSNTVLLSKLYSRFNSLLLNYDRATMDETFKAANK